MFAGGEHHELDVRSVEGAEKEKAPLFSEAF
jgi:hypothetical protein